MLHTFVHKQPFGKRHTMLARRVSVARRLLAAAMWRAVCPSSGLFRLASSGCRVTISSTALEGEKKEGEEEEMSVIQDIKK